MTAPKFAYFVHDASHADIWRRVQMFDAGGAETRLLGFRRRAEPDPNLLGRTVDLGQTKDGNFVHRALSVGKARLSMDSWGEEVRGADVVIARNLEMLTLAAAARKRYAPNAPLIYECLDIHRLISASHPAGATLRKAEQALLKQCDALVVSSPGFVREHFARWYGETPKVILLENKVFFTGAEKPRTAQSLPSGPPWKIGWFGLIRCRRSFEILSNVARAHPGLIEVTIAGRPAEPIFGAGGEGLKGVPGVEFIGSFKDEAALADLFSAMHFAWAVDFYEAGGNSDWLLPNRLYRALLYGAVPIADAGVETGRWLESRNAGIRLAEPIEETLVAALQALDSTRLAMELKACSDVPTADLVMDADACRALVADLVDVRDVGRPRA